MPGRLIPREEAAKYLQEQAAREGGPATGEAASAEQTARTWVKKKQEAASTQNPRVKFAQLFADAQSADKKKESDK